MFKISKVKIEDKLSAKKSDMGVSIRSILVGIFMSIIFCATNAYLGLRAGTTISAAIPISIISIGIFRYIFKTNSVQECNMVQTIGAMGEAVISGMNLTLPAIFLWYSECGLIMPDWLTIFKLAIVGSVLGILFTIPLRRVLIADKNSNLPFPEGTACAEVLIATQKGGSKAKIAFFGSVVGAIYKFLSDGLNMFSTKLFYAFKFFKGAGLGIDVSPALLGVGFIVGREISCYMLAGGILGWVVIMPLIYQFGCSTGQIIYPATISIADMNLIQIWANYIRYVGAGAVAAGGILSLLKSFPIIIKTFKDTAKSYAASDKGKNNSDDIPLNFILLSVVVIFLMLSAFDLLPIGWLGSVIVILFGFLFSTVSIKMVGAVGSSNNPISGMTISTLLIATVIFKFLRMTNARHMDAIFCIGIIICVIVSVSGVMSQSLKTGHILKASPKLQEVGTMIGVFSSSVVSVCVLKLLDNAWRFGSEKIPAPQASLIKLVVEGVMYNKLPWVLVLTGVGITVCVELLNIPAMSFALGLFLPIELSTALAVGGFIRGYFDGKVKCDVKLSENRDRAVLFSSGLIAGEGLIGIFLAGLAVLNVKTVLSDVPIFQFDATIVCFGLLCLGVLFFLRNKKD